MKLERTRCFGVEPGNLQASGHLPCSLLQRGEGGQLPHPSAACSRCSLRGAACTTASRSGRITTATLPEQRINSMRQTEFFELVDKQRPLRRRRTPMASRTSVVQERAYHRKSTNFAVCKSQSPHAPRSRTGVCGNDSEGRASLRS